MIVVIDYGLGNLKSVGNALEKLEIPFRVSSKISMVKKAKALILPGVGAAGEGMSNLRRTGLYEILIKEIRNGKSILGICLGMQLLFKTSEEGNVDCLRVLQGKVKKFSKIRKVPQIGWNQVKLQIANSKLQKEKKRREKLFQGIPDKSYFYFVNSYYCVPEDESIVLAVSKYGEEFPSIVGKDNIIATQFHPEKSGKVGFRFLKNFTKVFL